MTAGMPSWRASWLTWWTTSRAASSSRTAGRASELRPLLLGSRDGARRQRPGQRPGPRNQRGSAAMDPLACWNRLCVACAEGDMAEAADAAEDLDGWRVGGGFRPEAIPADVWRQGALRD